MYVKSRKIRNYLESHYVFHFSSLSVADARMEKTRGHTHPQRLAGHPRSGGLAVGGDHTKSAEQQHQQALRIDG